ncbi:unnamed protein product [Candidula unifasciata]|uniref:BRISC and BRCA1-A complex member 1 n=1 Tax=Candidula unifasciata TaxID=100452 RepID=A0A8S3ZTI4_9EUPU|nr:unnamed protein product [Candidula unifasciata]
MDDFTDISSRAEADMDTSYNNPSSNNSNMKDSGSIYQHSDDIFQSSSEPEGLASYCLNDPIVSVDSSDDTIFPAASSVCKQSDSSSQKSLGNNNETSRLAVLEEGNKMSCLHPEMVSRHDPQSIQCPRVNCPEKIIICLDLNEEMDTSVFRSRAGDKYTGLELAKRAIKMFVMHKSQINPKNQFSFLIFHEESTMIQSFTPRAQDILNTLDEIEIETQMSGPLNLSHLFETVKENIELPVVDGDPRVISPPYVVRVILVFGRSNCVPVVTSTKAQRELESSPYFFTDVLYIHDPPSENNKCEEIFHTLCDLDHNGMSYIFEQSKYTPVLNSSAKLLAHPLQRPRQLEAMYRIGAVQTAPAPPPTPSE